MQFKLRSLLVITALAAVLTMPTYHFSVALYEKWNKPEEGITVQLPRLTFRPDGSKWAGGKMLRKPTK